MRPVGFEDTRLRLTRFLPAVIDLKILGYGSWNGIKMWKKTIYRSKAIGEPPLTLAVSAFNAITDAVASVCGYELCPRLDARATPERILMKIEDLKKRRASLA